MPLHYLNNKLVSEEELLISPRDVGFSRGYAVFDFLKTYNRRPFKLEEHIDRLLCSAQQIGLQVPWSRDKLISLVVETLDANNDDEEKFIKIFLSGGISNSMLPSKDPTLIILVDPATVYPEERYEQGIGIITVKHNRYVPTAKTNNYIEGMLRCQEALSIQAEEPLYYSDSQVYEGSNSNIFAVINGVLTTPEHNILAGITRNVLLEIIDHPIEVRNFTIEELATASEVFLTGSGKEISPVTAINGAPVGTGSVGPITRDIIHQFRAHTTNWSQQ